MRNGEAPTVLIVDDDPQVLRLVEEMLRSRPLRVLLAPNAAEALEICQRESVQLLISDLVMPEIDGNRLAERVLRIQPDARVLLISGYAKTPLAKTDRIRFLSKPFFPSQLLQHLQELLPE